jgi:hypothetical protein
VKYQVPKLRLPLLIQANNLAVQHRLGIPYRGGDIVGEVGERRDRAYAVGIVEWGKPLLEPMKPR